MSRNVIIIITHVELGRALQEEIDRGYDPVRIARRAYEMYLDAQGFEAGLEPEILKLIALDQGGQFELSEAELRAMAGMLQSSRESKDSSDGNQRDSERVQP
jgi:hypothetical protein